MLHDGHTRISFLVKYDKILVTGPQRSGTRIAARVVAAELGYRYVDELEVGLDSLCRLYALLGGNDKIVIQGPSFSSLCHWIDTPKTLVIFVMRDVEEIHRSERRVGWDGEAVELSRYFCESGPAADVKYDVWHKFQKSHMKVPWLELSYNSLSSHPLWVAETGRSMFGTSQTSIDGNEPSE